MNATDDRFKEFIKGYLDVKTYNKLLARCRCPALQFATFLTSMTREELSENVFVAVDQFLASLPREEASCYVNKHNERHVHLLFRCLTTNMIKYVIKYVSDINVIDKCGNSILTHACTRTFGDSKISTMRLLLDRGIDVNIKNNINENALMQLCHHFSAAHESENLEQAIELLIFSGVDPFIKSQYGNTAYDFVRDKTLLTPRSSQLLQGYIKMNNTKRASNANAH